MNLPTIQSGLWVAAIVAEILLAGALISRGLARKYPFFLLFLACDAAWGIALIRIDFETAAYATAFRVYFIQSCVLKFAAVAELYEGIAQHFQGIGTFRFYMAGLLAMIAAVLSLSTFQPNLRASWAFPQTIAVFVKRHESMVLVGILVLTRFVLYSVLNARPPMRQNVARHWVIFTAYLAIEGIAETASLVHYPNGYLINVIMLAGQFTCLLAWIKCLDSTGETVPYFWRLTEREVSESRARRGELMDLVTSLPGEISEQLRAYRDSGSRRRNRF